jgi:HPt (histidine-containing phosphotransfer) domain-containing protein
MRELSAGQRQQLEALRQAYAAELPEKVTAISHMATVMGNWNDRATVRELHHLVHRLAGSSAIWGFAAIGNAAAELEEVLLSALEENRPPRPDLSADVRRLLEALQQAVLRPGGASGR